ncbi:tyrosine-type recombinase/integrase [Acinetobacter pittii]|uniref:tyrosine-type recombinase/integrase n=1 Tax=Acinetobacter pittii TaxID=48296 RepID=UPI001BD02822|nr:tyrosine-type recombinase/integrase [Acinetobacter pittii]
MIKRSIKKFIASDKHPIVILIDENRIPLFYPNVYAMTKFRTLGRAASTTEKVLRCIGTAHLWASLNKIALEESILFFDFLTIEQLQDLAFFLRLKRNHQDQIASKKDKQQSLNPQKILKKIENIIYIQSPNQETKSATSAEEGAFQIKTIFNYFEFLLQRSKHRLNKNKFNDIEQRLNYFYSLAPKVSNKGDQDAPEGLSIDERNTLIEIINPKHPDNPFRNEFLKHRNQLIYEIMLSTGMRRSELRFLKIEDVNYSTHTINIRVSKTVQREVKCSSKACEYFHIFLTKYLNKIPFKHRKHGYLFTTEKGKHLSNDAINLTFRTLRQHAEITTCLTPHTMRRTWNDIFSEMIDSLPSDSRPDKEIEKQIRNRLMGWSSISEMSNRYARRSIREKADELAELLANSILIRPES